MRVCGVDNVRVCRNYRKHVMNVIVPAVYMAGYCLFEAPYRLVCCMNSLA